MQISEDILDQLIQEDTEPQIHYASRVYLSKTTAICGKKFKVFLKCKSRGYKNFLSFCSCL